MARQGLERLDPRPALQPPLWCLLCRVVSVQIYDHVEAMEYVQAHWLAGGMVAFSFLVLLALYTLNPTGRKGR